MPLTFATEAVALVIDADGVARVGQTRVPLETVIMAFTQGATAEEIAQQYPSLHLADVYQVIGFYLRRTAEVEAYLVQRNSHVERVRGENESRFDPRGVRARLLARRRQTA